MTDFATTVRLGLAGFEDAEVWARTVILRGTDAANHLVGVGRTSVRVLGLAGPDRIRVGFNDARAPLHLRERTAQGGRDETYCSARRARTASSGAAGAT